MRSWLVRCPWCCYRVFITAVSGGVEAVRVAAEHAGEMHGKTWRELLTALAAAAEREDEQDVAV